MKKYLIAAIPGVFLYGAFYLYLEQISGDTFDEFLRIVGRVAFFYIILSLMVTPIISLTGKQNLLKWRRPFGVIAFVFAIIHTIKYFIDAIENMNKYHRPISTVIDELLQGDALTGGVAFLLILILGLTSNNYSVNLLKSFWGKLQSLAYPLFLIVALHVAYASRFEIFYILAISTLIALRTVAYMKASGAAQAISVAKDDTPKWRCIPCGYIYDEKLGDPDSGIAPGTKFEDIPDNWRCPICGVGKDQFEKIGGDAAASGAMKQEKISATVESVRNLTGDVIELKITPSKFLVVSPGQYAKFLWQDEQGEFLRCYSVADYTDGMLTFCIKISKSGRGGKVLKTLLPGQEVFLGGIGGDFVLRDNSRHKVFLATGTGLSPIIMMLRHLKGGKAALLFGVRNESDVFYEEEMKSIHGVKSYIFCSALEKNNGDHIAGRVNLDEMTFPRGTEFYLCGNPAMVESATEKIKAKGFTNIYYEQF